MGSSRQAARMEKHIGNAGDYYCASNSLLHDILGRSGMGIPISLCIIHAAVCQRIGIPVHLLRMPMVRKRIENKIK
eukprot:scaffold143946_cov19-Tisochrysis_lutea.AAC.1